VRHRCPDTREPTAVPGLAPPSRARIGVVEAHHAALRSSSHSSMKAENWFQLRIVGVTIIARLLPGFFYRRAHWGRATCGFRQQRLPCSRLGVPSPPRRPTNAEGGQIRSAKHGEHFVEQFCPRRTDWTRPMSAHVAGKMIYAGVDVRRIFRTNP